MDDQPTPRPRGMGAKPRRPRGLGRTGPAAAGAAPGLARLLDGDPLIVLTTAEACLVLGLLDQVDALATVTGRPVDPDAAALAAKLRSGLDGRSV